ncbi:FAD-binding oxidoreductase [Rhizobium sp. TRM96647]|uniref:NAD(P)/FAD-dependent oxidoreductase n=1 Tax=unclassified Rhizobium TaxID=2613769 RepID=UPI0021E76D30|nr:MULTISPECIES: FAD-dependent oxidoreductase [unclassified Rhizobium]MCV3738152.1 FAD-binding oxidoreductase [Rhizobium sp. TRM96647]MCV3759839.1 FAD-binding oxidoreductase [Rhizobium sp. TRM96650]
MPPVDSRLSGPGQPQPDVLVIGGGVMGLWAALMAARAGLSVLVTERHRVGAGASGGLLGALMPHLPDRWNAKKQFQLEALVSLEDEISTLEAATGLSAGYRRCGRVIPLAGPHHRERALKHSRDATAAWDVSGRTFSFDVHDRAPAASWPAGEAAASGVVLDSLAARVSPRGLLALLRAALEAMPQVRLAEGVDIVRLDPVARAARCADGTDIAFGHVMVCAGVAGFELLTALEPRMLPRPLGVAVKGQAALFAAVLDPDLPILFDNGIYVVPHDGGYCAVGSTSEDAFGDAASTDGLLDDVIERAQRIAPVLRQASLVERWAGLRPKAIGRDPMAGLHPEFPSVAVLGGGFKISFGIAHELARAVVKQIDGGSAGELPPSFAIGAHLEAARRDLG